MCKYIYIYIIIILYIYIYIIIIIILYYIILYYIILYYIILYYIIYIYIIYRKKYMSHGLTFGSLGRAQSVPPPFSAVSGPLSIWHGGLPTALSQDANGFSASEKKHHSDGTVMPRWDFKVPKGGHLKTDPVEKECDILHKSSYVAVSENSVPLNPMVNDHYPY